MSRNFSLSIPSIIRTVPEGETRDLLSRNNLVEQNETPSYLANPFSSYLSHDDLFARSNAWALWAEDYEPVLVADLTALRAPARSSATTRSTHSPTETQSYLNTNCHILSPIPGQEEKAFRQHVHKISDQQAAVSSVVNLLSNVDSSLRESYSTKPPVPTRSKSTSTSPVLRIQQSKYIPYHPTHALPHSPKRTKCAPNPESKPRALLRQRDLEKCLSFDASEAGSGPSNSDGKSGHAHPLRSHPVDIYPHLDIPSRSDFVQASSPEHGYREENVTFLKPALAKHVRSEISLLVADDGKFPEKSYVAKKVYPEGIHLRPVEESKATTAAGTPAISAPAPQLTSEYEIELIKPLPSTLDKSATFHICKPYALRTFEEMPFIMTQKPEQSTVKTIRQRLTQIPREVARGLDLMTRLGGGSEFEIAGYMVPIRRGFVVKAIRRLSGVVMGLRERGGKGSWR